MVVTVGTSSDSWHDFPLSGGPEKVGVGGTIGGEHTVGYYIAGSDGNAVAQIVNCPSAQPPDAPPDANKAPEFHYNTVPDTTQPQAVFDSSGICTSGGWTAGGASGGFYAVGDTTGNPTGTPPATLAASAQLQAAALAFAQASGLK